MTENTQLLDNQIFTPVLLNIGLLALKLKASINLMIANVKIAPQSDFKFSSIFVLYLIFVYIKMWTGNSCYPILAKKYSLLRSIYTLIIIIN